MPDRREYGHAQAALGDQDLRGVGLNAGIVHSSSIVWAWGEHELDPLGEVLQSDIERVDVRQQLGDRNPVMLDLKAALDASRNCAIFKRILDLASGNDNHKADGAPLQSACWSGRALLEPTAKT